MAVHRHHIFFLAAALFFGLAYWMYTTPSSESSSSLVSPVPALANFAEPSTVLWRPSLEQMESPYLMPHLTARAILVYDVTTDKILYQKNPHARLPMASLTKIMTAIIALENDTITKEYTVSEHAATIGENAMGLTSGEVIKLEDLLYGLILPSGNDAAEAIAEGSKFGRDDFVFEMNKKAENLGLTNTRFTNPSGLEGDGNQYSTAYDLLVMTHYGLLIDEFAKVVSTVEHFAPGTPSHKAFALYNETNLLTSYPGVKGVKTGFTNEAGMCLVTYLEYGGHQIIGVILNSENRRQEMKDLLDYSLKTLGITPPPHS